MRCVMEIRMCLFGCHLVYILLLKIEQGWPPVMIGQQSIFRIHVLMTCAVNMLWICMCVRCSEWLVNQHRDSFASYIGHPNLMEFFAVAENESKARVKFSFLQVLPEYFMHTHLSKYLLCVIMLFYSIEDATTLWASTWERWRWLVCI